MGAVLPLQPPCLPVRRFTVAEYRRLAEVEILSEEERVELLEGWIVFRTVHNPPHDNAVELVDEALRAELPAGWRVRVQSSITTADSEPEPDVTLVRGRPVIAKGVIRSRAKLVWSSRSPSLRLRPIAGKRLGSMHAPAFPATGSSTSSTDASKFTSNWPRSTECPGTAE